MTLRRLFSALLLFVGGLGFQSTSLAGPPETPPTNTSAAANDDPIFHRGALELQVTDGAIYSLQYTGLRRPNIDYELTVVRLGYMLDSPHAGGSFLRGNDELMLEGTGGPIFQGPGSGLGSLSIIYRRNFLAPGAWLVPYLNLGGGGLYSNAYRDQVQQAIGSRFEFDLQASVGLRYRLARHWTVDGEFAYRHISNAHFAERNLGTNGIGGLLGASYSF